MSSWPFTPDMERSELVFGALAKRWGEGSFAFNHLTPPEREYLPQAIEQGSLQHAWWLFFTGWLSRQGFSAKQVFTGAQYILEERGTDLIDPNMVGMLTVHDYEEIKGIVPYGYQEPHRVEVWWRECLMVLRDEHKGDPRNLLLTLDLKQPLPQLRHDMMKRFKRFKGKGIGHKIAQLTIGWFQETEWPQHKKKWRQIRRIPVVAVDLWWMRMVYQLGLIADFRSDITTKISQPLADYVCQVCMEAGINHNHLAQAMWHLGKDYCARARTRSRSLRGDYRQICAACPAHDYCLGIVPTNSHDEDGKKKVHADIGWTKFQPHPSGAVYNYTLPL